MKDGLYYDEAGCKAGLLIALYYCDEELEFHPTSADKLAELPGAKALPALYSDDEVVASGLEEVTSFLAGLSGDGSDEINRDTLVSEIRSWISRLEKEKPAVTIQGLNKHLATHAFLLFPTAVSPVDLLVFASVYGEMKRMKAKERCEMNHFTRWFDCVQHQPPRFSNQERIRQIYPRVSINLEYTPPEKQIAGGRDRQKGMKADCGNAAKKGKAEKGQRRAPPAQAPEISKMAIIVGKIVEVSRHPEAEKLYVEKIDMGEKDLRTIVSGLVDFVPIDQMKDRMVVVAANLKPTALRGITSSGMVLCASNDDHTKVEPLRVPEGCVPGERISFEGIAGEADEELGKKVLPRILKKLATDDDKVACYDGKPFMTSKGPVFCDSLSKSPVK